VVSGQRKRKKKARAMGDKTENTDIGSGRSDDDFVPFLLLHHLNSEYTLLPLFGVA
jgi:hypothetical protein